MVGAWQGKDIPRLNNAVEPPRRRRDKGDKTAERSSAVALNGVDSLSAFWAGFLLVVLNLLVSIWVAHISTLFLVFLI